MTFSPKVWGDALRRLQSEIPEFTYDAWIAPLAVKIADDRLVLGCPTSFHRDRIRNHHIDAIQRACRGAMGLDPLAAGSPVPIDLLTKSEFAEAEGQRFEISAITAALAQESRVGMKRVGVAPQARAVNGADSVASPISIDAPVSTSTTSTTSTTPTTPMTPMTARSRAAGAPGSSVRPEPVALLHAVPLPSDRRDAQVAQSEKGAASVRNDAVGATRSYGEPRTDGGPSFGLEGQPRKRQDEPFNFENFIVGPCNALAREATLALARQRQQSLNLLYLGGLSGMGKTHLAKAAAQEARLQLPEGRNPRSAGPAASQPTSGPRSRVIYTTAEQFTSEFVSAMRNGRNDAWAKRYRGPVELLIVEDIQFLAGRTKTQQELFHTVGHVLDRGGRVLLTGDRTPRDLTGLDERLRAQVGHGFVAELDRPDAIVRRHILRAKAAAGGVKLPADCLDLLVDATESEIDGASVTEVESLLIQVVTTSSLLGRPVDLALVKEAIDLKTGAAAELAPRQIEVSEIVKIVAGFFGARPEALASRSRRRDVLVPRQLSMYLAHRYTDVSLTEIGRGLGRDHPSVRNAIQRVEKQILENAPLRYQVEALSERIDKALAERH